MSGPFAAELILDESRPRRIDLDNAAKCCLDYAVRIELVEDDRFASKLSIELGHAPHGAILRIWPADAERLDLQLTDEERHTIDGAIARLARQLNISEDELEQRLL
jgi:hypothetical protein